MADIELLSPAGGMAQLKAAVQSGADAVYLGGPLFSARYGAANFSAEELKEAVKYCHIYGTDVHAAVNTLIKEKELDSLEEYISLLADIGVDAVLVQDMGAAELIKKICPSMPLHASTQMTVTSLEGVRYLEDMGFSRVVLSRELSCDEIAKICAGAKAEIEVFVHGAICMCYSGQCLMSSILGGRSGNRGRCAQPCRLPYTLTDGKDKANAHILSPKDMALINELDTLRRIGVKSLKIEGRLKRPEYVSAVTGLYRKYLDYPSKVSADDMNELQNAFSRGFTDGYFKNRLGKGMMSHKDPSNSQNSFTKEAIQRANGEIFTRKIPVNIEARISEWEPMELCISDFEGHSVSVYSEEIAEAAKNTPLDEARVKKQLAKLGSTPYVAENVNVCIDDNVIIGIGAINSLRREAAELLSEQRAYRKEKKTYNYVRNTDQREKHSMALRIEVRTENQLRAAMDCGIQEIIAPASVIKKAAELGFKGKLIQKCSDIYKNEELLCGDVEISNAASAVRYDDVKRYGGFRLNVYNSESVQHYSYLESVTLSPELNLKEIRELLNNTDVSAEIIAYGRIPLMLMKNCPVKAMGRCAKSKSSYVLKDRKNQEFPLICLDDCKCMILNSKPLFMADKIRDMPNVDFARLMFTVEDYNETVEIINLYKDALNANAIVNPFGENEFTRGHFYRGVE